MNVRNNIRMCVFALAMAQPVYANVEVSFFESAPKDRFVIKNISKCALENLIVEIDLTKSAGRLIFDTTAAGAGVEVFQPFEVREGSIDLISPGNAEDGNAEDGDVEDGDSKLSVSIASLLADETASFTIDVDDTLPKSELGKIRVSGAEIEGGLVKIGSAEGMFSTGVFNSNSKTVVVLPPCSKQ